MQTAHYIIPKNMAKKDAASILRTIKNKRNDKPVGVLFGTPTGLLVFVVCFSDISGIPAACAAYCQIRHNWEFADEDISDGRWIEWL